jgi:hypothetical protein
MTTKTLKADKTYIELALAVAKCAARATGRRQRKLERDVVSLLNTAAGLGRGWDVCAHPQPPIKLNDLEMQDGMDPITFVSEELWR